MRALITGANGFVGPHLCRHLEACGDTVIGIDRSTGGPDLLDPAGLDACLARARPEAVYHLAGFSDVASSWEHPLAALRANAEGTLNVLTAARAHGATRVLVVSSADVYGLVTPAEVPLTESSPLRPTSPYAASKAAAERVAEQAFHGWGTEVVIVRSFNHLGPGQSPRFVAPALAARIASNELEGSEVVRVGNLTAERDFCDVRDVVRAYRLLVQRGAPGEVYNVCSGRARAVADLAEMLLAEASMPMRLVPDPSLLRPVEVPLLVGDRGKITAATGWEPTIPLEETLEDLLADQRERVAEDHQR